MTGDVAAGAKGNVEGVRGERLIGWGWWPQRPNEPARFEIAIDGSVVAAVEATTFRLDLVAAGIRGGYAGFEFALPECFLDGRPHTAEVRIRGDASFRSATTFSVAPDAGPAGPRFGAGRMLFAGETWPDGAPGVGHPADAALSVTEGHALLDGFARQAWPTVVIPVHNAAAALARCLRAVFFLHHLARRHPGR